MLLPRIANRTRIVHPIVDDGRRTDAAATLKEKAQNSNSSKSAKHVSVLFRTGSDCLQNKHVKVPRRVVDVEAVVDKFTAVAIVDFGTHYIGEAHFFAA